MELSDYPSALVRGWWLIVVFGLVGLSNFLLPKPSPAQLKSETHYVSSSSFGSLRPAPDSQFEQGISPDQMLYYVTSDSVMSSTASNRRTQRAAVCRAQPDHAPPTTGLDRR